MTCEHLNSDVLIFSDPSSPNSQWSWRFVAARVLWAAALLLPNARTVLPSWTHGLRPATRLEAWRQPKLPHAVARCLHHQQKKKNKELPRAHSCPFADPAALQSQPHAQVVSLVGHSRDKGRSMRHLALPETLAAVEPWNGPHHPNPRPPSLHFVPQASGKPTYSVIGPSASSLQLGALFPVDAHTAPHPVVTVTPSQAQSGAN